MAGRRGKLRALAISTSILVAVAADPVGFDPYHGFSVNQAIAGNGGNGGNGGNAGGNGVGNGGGRGNGGVNGHHGNPNAQANSNNSGDTASGLGALNAANASASAFNNASDNSRVGRIKAYRDALDSYLGTCTPCDSSAILDLAAKLAAASNKTLTTDTLNALDSLLGENPAATDPNWDSTTAPNIVTTADGL
jgi:hypothetical protein